MELIKTCVFCNKTIWDDSRRYRENLKHFQSKDGNEEKCACACCLKEKEEEAIRKIKGVMYDEFIGMLPPTCRNIMNRFNYF